MSNSAPWVVHKFGGSSVADAACFERVIRQAEAAEARAIRRTEVERHGPVDAPQPVTDVTQRSGAASIDDGRRQMRGHEGPAGHNAALPDAPNGFRHT